MKLAEVIVDVPLMQTDKPYTYEVPDDLADLIEVGMRVHVPFGAKNRPLLGLVVGLKEGEHPDLKAISELLDVRPSLTAEQLWLADQLRQSVFSYKISLLKAMLPNFLYSDYDKILRPTATLSQEEREAWFGQREQLSFSDLEKGQEKEVLKAVRAGKLVLDYEAKERRTVKTEKWFRVAQEPLAQLVLPKSAKRKQELADYLKTLTEEQPLASLREKFSDSLIRFFREIGIVLLSEREVNRAATYFEKVASSKPLTLNPEQAYAVEQMTAKIGLESPPILLEGVTGSGKTEVYLQVIEEVLARGKTAIMLVPEISLTPQVTQRFIARFGQQVAIMHSGLSNGEKFDEWRKIERGEAQVVVGARSAIFAPLANLGAIIIDEEHEASYKQDSSPRYHARDVALLRSQYNQALLVLGSATPSLESRARASRGVYDFVQLTQRANPLAKIPPVEVVDFRDYIGQQEAGDFTPPLVEAIAEGLKKGEQTVLMLNRRGYSSFVMCRECGSVDSCPNCDISLTLHMDTKTMNCHYCGFRKGIPRHCPACASSSIRYYGTGTQKAFDELSQLFPEARILRMDMDTTRKKGSHEQMLERFGRGDYDILLGTQMIAKGLDFPNVTLVGVLNADTALNLPDFRAAERTFQLLTQVAGRAGRAEKEGRVLIQTYNPQHYAIAFAKEQDYEGFYAYEMGIRRNLGYPPYYFTVGLTLSHKVEEVAVKQAYVMMGILRKHLSDQVQILGPTPKPIARTHNLYHYQILVKYKREEGLPAALNEILNLTQERANKDLRLIIDNEPQNVM